MKIKRIAALLLTVCLLLSLGTIVPALAAETKVDYNFTYLSSLNLELVKDRDYAKWYDDATTPSSNVETVTNAYGTQINSMPLYYSTEKPQAIQFSTDGISAPCTKDGFFAFTIKSPGAGTYSMSLVIFSSNTATATACNIYVLPADTTEAAIANGSALTESARVAENVNLKVGDDNVKNRDNLGNFTFEDGKDYIVVFNPTSERNGNAYVRLTSMSLTKVAGQTPSESTPSESTPSESTPSESTPSASTPSASTPSASTPSASTPTGSNPSTGENSGIVVMAALVIASFAAVSLVLLTNNKRKHA